MIYIGHFMHITNQYAENETDKRHGEFSMIVEAKSYTDAVQNFKDRVYAYRQTNTLFEGECSIFCIQLLEFTEIPKDYAMMMTYNSYAGEPVIPFIGCSVPNGGESSCKIYSWDKDTLEIDGYRGELFLAFNK